MIDSFRPYPEMKAAGLPWLGMMPAQWEVRRVKTLLREVDHRSASGKERLLSLRMHRGLVDHHEAGGKPIPAEALVGFKIVQPGQIVMNRMRASSGLFGVVTDHGLVSPDYAVFETKIDAYSPYLLYLFRLPCLKAVFRAESKGLGTGESGFLRLYTDRFGPIPIPYPPCNEQELIVRFLNWHGNQTAKLIRAKRQLLALLNEQRRRIVQQAVTQGLDHNVKRKLSGVAWLGDIPESWQVYRLKTFTENKIEPRTSRAKEEIYVALEHIESWTGRLIHRDFDTEFDSQVKAFAPGDVLFGKLRPYLAKVIRLGVGGVCVGELLVLRASKSVIDSEFLEYRMRSDDFIDHVNSSTSGAKMPRAEWDFLGNIQIAFPSSLKEQRAIVEYIQSATEKISEATRLIGDEIALLQDFRTRLISDVVTGNLDIREAAASLPEQADISEPLHAADEADAFEDDGREDFELEEAAA